MARTDATAVGLICEVDSTISLEPFIEVANQLVTEICGASAYSDERFEMIERWLAAHTYCTRDPRATSESVGVSQSNQLFTGANLLNTQYGQMVMLLDTDGNFAKLNGKVTDGKGPAKIKAVTLMTDADRAYYGVT